MPKLNQDLETTSLSTGNFSFSHQRIGSLSAMEYTLVDIEVDASGSTESFRPLIINCIKQVLKSCKYSKRADNLMLRLGRFSSKVDEVHGFKLLDSCNEDDYNVIFDNLPGGTTALYDSCVIGAEALQVYGTDLVKNNYDCNGIFVCITDGLDNVSRYGANTVRQKLAELPQKEKLESLVSILIAVNMTDPDSKKALESFSKAAGFSQYVDAGKVNDRMLAKLANFVSKSISSQSQSLHQGPSQALTF